MQQWTRAQVELRREIPVTGRTFRLEIGSDCIFRAKETIYMKDFVMMNLKMVHLFIVSKTLFI